MPDWLFSCNKIINIPENFSGFTVNLQKKCNNNDCTKTDKQFKTYFVKTKKKKKKRTFGQSRRADDYLKTSLYMVYINLV